MLLATLAILIGLPVLIWSAERFIHGASFTAVHFGISPLFIGMFIIGFGTSAPEIIVSVFSALQGNGGLALGNAFGSNISNITLILGTTAVISPIAVRSEIVRKEIPILLAITFLAVFLVYDLYVSLSDAIILLGVFALLIGWTVWQTMQQPEDEFANQLAEELEPKKPNINGYLIWLVVGLVVLVISSRVLVWGAVEVAEYFGVSEVIIGLTIIGIGTSLPELISSIIAVRKNEHELAIGNIVGSNLFNTLAVVGIAGIIQPIAVDPSFFYRDGLLMLGITILLLILALGFRGPGRISRWDGIALLCCFVIYNLYLIQTQFIATS